MIPDSGRCHGKGRCGNGHRRQRRYDRNESHHSSSSISSSSSKGSDSESVYSSRVVVYNESRDTQTREKATLENDHVQCRKHTLSRGGIAFRRSVFLLPGEEGRPNDTARYRQ